MKFDGNKFYISVDFLLKKINIKQEMSHNSDICPSKKRANIKDKKHFYNKACWQYAQLGSMLKIPVKFYQILIVGFGDEVLTKSDETDWQKDRLMKGLTVQ